MEESGCDGLIYKPMRKDLFLSVVEKSLGTNARNSPRIRVRIPAVVALGNREWGAVIHSLSSQGAFIEIDKGALIVGDLVKVSFTLPEGRRIDVGSAGVVWTGTLGPQGPCGAGVRFLSLPAEVTEELEIFVDEHLGSGMAGKGTDDSLDEKTPPQW